MRIAFILPSLKNAGPCIVAKDLVEQYVCRGNVCKVFYFKDILDLKFPCQVQKISFNTRIDFSEWDIVHSHTIVPDLYVRFNTLFSKRNLKTKFVTTLHNPINIHDLNLSFSLFKSISLAILWRISLSAHDAIIFLNNYLLNKTHLRSHAIQIAIPNGRNIDKTLEISSISDKILIKEFKSKYRIIGTTSNIIKLKGLEQIVNALPMLKNYALIVIGDGPELDNLKDLARLNLVYDRCLWLGYRQDAAIYHKYFDIFIMCTRSEGFPLALVEAAAYSNATVLSDIDILKSVITDKEVVFYELDNINDLKSKIEFTYENRGCYSKNINEYYKKNLTATVMAKKYLTLYEKLLNLN